MYVQPVGIEERRKKDIETRALLLSPFPFPHLQPTHREECVEGGRLQLEEEPPPLEMHRRRNTEEAGSYLSKKMKLLEILFLLPQLLHVYFLYLFCSKITFQD